MQQYLKTLLQFRKNNSTIHKGRTIHFSPKDGVYLMFRILDDNIVVLILNKNDQSYVLDLDKFKEIGLEEKTLKDVVSGKEILWEDSIRLEEKGATILTTLK